MRAAAIALVLSLLCPPVARAVDRPSAPASYLRDRFEIRLAPAAARRALAARSALPAGARGPLGVAALDRAADALGARFEPEFPGETPPPPGSSEPDFTSFYVVRLPAGADLESARGRFAGLSEVASAERVPVLPVTAVPDDSLWSDSWWFAQASGHDVHAVPAWDVTTGDTSVVVAILDTGVIPYHPDLGGTTAGLPGQLWTNWAERGGLPDVDDDGNGYVDDVRGWDFVERPDSTLIPPFEDWRDQDPDPNDYAGHGTLVAGLVGAITDNAHGMPGTAWRVRLMPLRVAWAEEGAPLGIVDMLAVARAVRYATRMHADVINCSFASLDLSGLGAALDGAVRAGVTVVAAAGNNGSPSYIGERDDVIAVAATDADDRVALFSSTGPWVDLAAPGAGIVSTFVARAWSDSIGYRQPAYLAPPGLNGTSFSAPLVSGAVALLDAWQMRLGRRRLTPRGAMLRLEETADDISALNPLGGYGAGRLDLWRALTDRVMSTAWRAGAPTVGPSVPLVLDVPDSRVAHATANSRLLVQDWETGDTLWIASLPGVPARQLAAADLGTARGIGLFVGTRNGRLAAFTEGGAPLPGFPVAAGSALTGGPAIGDLDGDGLLEIACGAADGTVWAWRLDGAVQPGFPVETDGSAIDAPVAITRLRAGAGAQIVAATQAGMVYAFGADGSAVPGWPAPVDPGPLAPVATRFGADTVVVVAAGTRAFVLRADGSQRARWDLPGTATADPALADLDGDGGDELLVPLAFPDLLAVLDSAGVAPAGRGWPAPLAGPAGGPPVVGWMDTTAAPRIVLKVGAGLAALTDSARALAVFPKPGGAGAFPTLARFYGLGPGGSNPAMKVVAGSGSDSLLYTYDTGGPPAWLLPVTLRGRWPTPRGNAARTGSRLDVLPPGAVTDLAARVEGDSVRLTWTEVGDDGRAWSAAGYDLRVTTDPAEAGAPGAGVAIPTRAPISGRTPDSIAVAVAPGARLWFWLRARDAAGNVGAASNVAAIGVPAPPPGVALAVRPQPGHPPLAFEWRGTGAEGIRIFDVTGRRVRTLRLSGSGGAAQWDGRDEDGRLVPAGLYLARLFGGSLRAQTRVVLLP